MSEGLEFLDETPEQNETVKETVQEQPEKPVKVEPEPEKGEEAAPPAAQTEAHHIPVTALLDEREKRQSAQREAEEARQRLKEMEARLRDLETPKQKPDFYSDPEAALAQREQVFEQRLWDQKLNLSETMAAEKHGAEVVEAAKQAFIAEVQQNPSIYGQLKQQNHPYDFVVNWHKRQQFLNEVQDPEAWKAQQLEALRAQLAAEAAQPPKPKLPPASLANAPSAGGEAKTPGTAFDSVFG